MAIPRKAVQVFFKAPLQFQIALRAFSVADSNPPVTQRFHGKTAVVTGSTLGIGLAAACRLAREGANVVICSSQQKNVDQALASVHKEGLHNISGVVCDTSQKKDRDKLLNHTITKHPQGIDILVSNVGVFLTKPILEATSEEWDKYINANLKSHSLLTQETLPYMRQRGAGAIVYTSSISAYVTVMLSSLYGISKTAMLGLTKMSASHLAPEKIRVNCVVPGLIETEMAQKAIGKDSTVNRYLQKALLKRIGTAEDVSGVIVFLCSDDASYITGESIIVSGGVHCRL